MEGEEGTSVLSASVNSGDAESSDAETLKVMQEKRHLSGAKLRGLRAGKGFNIVDQLNDLKKKTSSEFLAEWKPKLQPAKKEIKKIIAQRMIDKEARNTAAAIQAQKDADSKAAEARAREEEKQERIQKEYEKFLRYKSITQSPKKTLPKEVVAPELREELQLDVPEIEKKKVYDHLTNRFGAVEFNAMLKRRSLFQLNDARAVYTGLVQTLGGVKGLLNEKKQKIGINSAQYVESSPSKTDKVPTGTLILLNPATHTSDGMFSLLFTYLDSNDGQEDSLESPVIYHDGHYLGLSLMTSFSSSEESGASEGAAVNRSLPGWEKILPLWVPSCDFTCEYEIVEEPMNMIGREPGFSISFQAIPFVSEQAAHKAIRKASVEHVKARVKNRAATLTVCGGMSALSVAAFNDNKQVLRNLLDSGADTNWTSKFNNATSLHEAVVGENVEAVEMLLTGGANQTIKDSAGRTPLHIACTIGNVFVVKALCRGPLAKKAAQMTDKRGNKPNEVCKSSYCRSVLEGIMKGSHLVVRPPREVLISNTAPKEISC